MLVIAIMTTSETVNDRWNQNSINLQRRIMRKKAKGNAMVSQTANLTEGYESEWIHREEH